MVIDFASFIKENTMNKRGLSIFKGIIFALGFLIILFLYLSVGKKEDIEGWRQTYLWLSLIVSYLVLFFPIFFPPRDKHASGGIFITGIMYLASSIVFIIISLPLALLVYNGVFEKIFIPLLIQSIFLFFFLLEVFLCVFTTEHISSVTHTESQKLAGVLEIRALANALNTKVASLGDEHNVLKKDIAQLADDLRYLSPSGNPVARDIEQKIYVLLQEIDMDPLFTTREASNTNAISRIKEVATMLKQRKSIY